MLGLTTDQSRKQKHLQLTFQATNWNVTKRLLDLFASFSRRAELSLNLLSAIPESKASACNDSLTKLSPKIVTQTERPEAGR